MRTSCKFTDNATVPSLIVDPSVRLVAVAAVAVVISVAAVRFFLVL
jgi:hypothetical protein